jgi:hypothetical protein
MLPKTNLSPIGTNNPLGINGSYLNAPQRGPTSKSILGHILGHLH